MPGLITGGLGDPTDRGGADPGVAAALAAFAAGRGSEYAALTALAGARLLVPVVAVLAEAADEGGTGIPGPPGAARRRGGKVSEAAGAARRRGGKVSEAAGAARRRGGKVSEMALPTLVGSDGRVAVLAFTCLRSLTAWRPDARPVPVTARQAWQAGVQEASAVVIDVAGPVPLAVDGARLAALAAGRPPPPPHADPDVRALAAAVLAGEPMIAGFALLPGEDGGDLTIQLRLAPGYGPAHDQAQTAIQRAAERIVAGAGGRARRGITVTASMSDRPAHARAGGAPATSGERAGGGPQTAVGGTPGAEASGP